MTSTFDMFPTTLYWLSTTANDDTPSLFINFKASFTGLSPLQNSNVSYDHFILPSHLNDILDGNHILRPNAEFPEILRVQLINDRKAPSIFPQKLHQPALAQNPNRLVCCFSHNHDAVNPSPESFHRPSQIGIVRQSDEWLFVAQTLSIT